MICTERIPEASAMPMPGKIRAPHRDRLAVVYVRQSSPQQVLEHRESAALPYALRRRARDWEWPSERVLVIDEDQGCSGTSAKGRMGFQRLLAEVSLDHVGLVLGIEMSRLARSCKDWHPLLELCAVFGTLLADHDGLYDPRENNDRLLLGRKGTLREAELHLLQQRMHQGRLNKARRGELFNHPPIGYLRQPHGELALDPDEQVQGVVPDSTPSWSGARSTAMAAAPPTDAAESAASSDVRRRLHLGSSARGPAAQDSGSAVDRAQGGVTRTMPGIPQRSLPGVHHVGALPKQSAAAGGQPGPGPAPWRGAGRLGAAPRLAGLRALRMPQEGAIRTARGRWGRKPQSSAVRLRGSGHGVRASAVPKRNRRRVGSMGDSAGVSRTGAGCVGAEPVRRE